MKSSRSVKSRNFKSLFFKLSAVVYFSFLITFLLTSPTSAYFQDSEEASVNISFSSDFGEEPTEPAEDSSSKGEDNTQSSSTEGQQQSGQQEATDQSGQHEKTDTTNQTLTSEQSSAHPSREVEKPDASSEVDRDQAEAETKGETKSEPKEANEEDKSTITPASESD
ncbi:hypothetical protein [Lentibacillus salicampi]|uniref:Uncharacterized protein n=1 Tax=Lentibacillus salicampi TaxID=175306 RepID=A0A4Y9AAX1_9BACI|nr:hypothetical protein [Lentibacillus salicampi]TFJ92472.1 hypothetical protein E4U82_12100 [Lentibacillus salicampi]